MSAAFPVADYAEDQPLARTILTTHVIHRGFQSGAAAGTVTGSLAVIIPRYWKTPTLPGFRGVNATAPPNRANGLLSPSKAVYTSQRAFSSSSAMTSVASSPNSTPLKSKTGLAVITRFTGVGGMFGAGLMTVMLPYYMSGRDYVEWQDRSWRLLDNQGQVAVDNWSISGALLAIASPAVIARLRSPNPWSLILVVGRAGMGSLAGVMGSYLV